MEHDIQLRPGRLEDSEAVEELILRIFSSTFRPALGNVPLETQVRVQVGLRLTRRQPTEGMIVAMDGPNLAGVVMGNTAEMGRSPFVSRLRALSPLGILGTLRFLLINLTVYTHYKPAPNEIYLYGLTIAPAYRRRGIGRALMQRIEETGQEAGKTVACGFIVAQNLASRALCQKLGYHESDVQKKPLRGWVLGEPEVVRVEKLISPQ